jgi:energy-converting hydrogenase A subunit M
MSSLEAINPRFESSQLRCIKERIHADLRLCWLCDVMNIVTEEESDRIQNKIAHEVLRKNKSYDKAIEEGRKDLLEDLMR